MKYTITARNVRTGKVVVVKYEAPDELAAKVGWMVSNTVNALDAAEWVVDAGGVRMKRRKRKYNRKRGYAAKRKRHYNKGRNVRRLVDRIQAFGAELDGMIQDTYDSNRKESFGRFTPIEVRRYKRLEKELQKLENKHKASGYSDYATTYKSPDRKRHYNRRRRNPCITLAQRKAKQTKAGKWARGRCMNPSASLSKVFDISTARGLKAAEQYKNRLNNKFSTVKVVMVGADKIRITGSD